MFENLFKDLLILNKKVVEWLVRLAPKTIYLCAITIGEIRKNRAAFLGIGSMFSQGSGVCVSHALLAGPPTCAAAAWHCHSES
jgi:hypothetical protein